MNEEMRDQHHVASPEQLQSPRKVFRVPATYGMHSSEMGIVGGFDDAETEQRHLTIAESHGYEIVRGGGSDDSNPYEIGMGGQGNIPERQRDETIAQRVGIQMPKLYSPSDVLATEETIVAKAIGAQRGELKFLLETKEQKQKFLAWAMISSRIAGIYDAGIANLEKVESLMAKVAAGDYEDPLFSTASLGRWNFEERIETPGEFNTSFRTVADAFGRVHYSQVARSLNPKNTAILEPTHRYSQLPTTEIALWGVDLSIFLTHPGSPFYISPKQFTSNISTGGSRILLDGQPARAWEDRSTLAALGIDPDHPTPPDSLVGISSAIGQQARGEYPFVGVDYLARRSPSGLVLLEINLGPQLSPKALGIEAGADEAECDAIMMDRVLASV